MSDRSYALLFILLLPAIVLALRNKRELEAAQNNNNFAFNASQIWKVREGDICSTKRHPLPAAEPDRFYECLQPTVDRLSWPWEDIGIWVKRACQAGRLFYAEYKTCRSIRSVRRQSQFCQQYPSFCNVQVAVQTQQPQPMMQQQQQACPQCPVAQPQPCVTQACPVVQPVVQPQPQPQPCPAVQCPQPQPTIIPQQPQPVVVRPCPLVQGGGAQGAQAGGICSWMLDPLATDPTSIYFFLQCAPASPGLYCGRWVRMPCAPGTRFDVSVQVCVHDENATPNPIQPVIVPTIVQPTVTTCTTGTVPIAPCNFQQQCPGYSSCQSTINVCCQPTLG